jgi:hypothetical protein
METLNDKTNKDYGRMKTAYILLIILVALTLAMGLWFQFHSTKSPVGASPPPVNEPAPLENTIEPPTLQSGPFTFTVDGNSIIFNVTPRYEGK